jgi:hypothetical protein
MSDKPELALLIEIAKLLKKYGPETFEKLAENLSSAEFSQRLTSVLFTTARTARSAKKDFLPAEAKLTPRDFRSSLVALGKTESEKSELLIKFYDGLSAKVLLPTLREIQSFASDMGLPSLKATARDKALVPFVKSFLPLSIEEIRTKLARIQPVSSANDRSLEGWSNIILDKERRSKQ